MMYEKNLVEEFDEEFDDEEWDEEEWDFYEDERSNAPCDNAGFCVGRTCPFFIRCQTK